jgi:PhoPQ-activated pathogenicity-related protein
VNEDPNAKMIRELREELDRLRAEVGFFCIGGVSRFGWAFCLIAVFDMIPIGVVSVQK